MLARKAESALTHFWESGSKKALLVSGARQVGKTFSIRRACAGCFSTFTEFNLLENEDALRMFSHAKNADDLIRGMTALSGAPLPPGETLVFIDEVQECREIVTAVKFLVEDGRFRYVLSGSLLGIELKDIRSMPVGYMDEIEMFPLDIEEFARANGLQEEVLAHIRSCYENKTPVDDVVHAQMMKLIRLYAIVGGMPAVVQRYLDTNDIQNVITEQRAIINLYKKDIAKYDTGRKLYLEEILALIPSELNAQNKRFILKNLNENGKFSRYENSFIWLKDAGVALPCHVADEPKEPLMLSKSTTLFKLFLVDTGLLSSMLMNGIQLRLLNNETDMNYGVVYENMMAQELTAHGFTLYYYNNKKNGEVDFLLEHRGKILPLEIKSGKTYKRHSALNKLLADKNYDIGEAYVLCNGNVETHGGITYYPVYMSMFLEKEASPEPMIYRIDLRTL